MALDGKILAKARERLAERHETNLAEHNARQARVYAQLPEIERIDRRLREQMIELMGLAISKSGDRTQRIETLKQESLDLQARRAELLCGSGFDIAYLDDIYSCPECRDTGFVGGKPCKCLLALYNRELTSELGTLLKSGAECFERFDLSLYGEARNGMALVYETCREYAANFSDCSLNLLFQGGTGLGKTFLSACIARVVADKGFSVCYDTAAAAFDAFETKKFARDPETADCAARKVERMLDCDLMILDDLGTEMPTPMAVSALYTLINTRLVNGKKTVISTNLSDEELQKRYSPQICSRIDGEFTKLPFVGQDIRKIKKEM